MFDRHAELAGDSSQRLHRWRSQTSLDPRDVRITDAGRGKVALRQAAPKAKPLQSRADALTPRHDVIFPRAPLTNGLCLRAEGYAMALTFIGGPDEGCTASAALLASVLAEQASVRA
jgi:hypothetical protein